MMMNWEKVGVLQQETCGEREKTLLGRLHLFVGFEEENMEVEQEPLLQVDVSNCRCLAVIYVPSASSTCTGGVY